MRQATPGHAHQSAASGDRKSLVAVLGVSLVVFLFELVGGLLANSLALLADAGHVFTDVAGISLALGAIWIARRPASDDRTYGWHRAEIVAATLNAVLLLGVAVFILYEAWRRLFEPPDVSTGLMILVATLGAVANGGSVLLLRRAKERSLNMRGAYLEVLSDMLGSVAVVVAGLVIVFTGWLAADAVASAVIGILILPRTWSLLREAVDVLLEATPKGIRIDALRAHLLGAAGVADIHDLHAWTITSGLPVVSAHVVLKPGAHPSAVLEELCQCLAGDFDVEHSTLQLETQDRRRIEEQGHR